MPDQRSVERQAKLLSVMSAISTKPMSLTLLQKVIFLCSQNVRSCDVDYSFTMGHFGPFSKDLVADIQELKSEGKVRIRRGRLVTVRSQVVRDGSIVQLASEFKSRFPDEATIIRSALTSPNVYGRAVGEPIEISRP